MIEFSSHFNVKNKNTAHNTADTPNMQYPSAEIFPLHLGEGMGGSLFWKDLISLAQSVGFSTPHLVSATQIVVYNSELKAKAGKKKQKKQF